jgi:hypothetical protein
MFPMFARFTTFSVVVDLPRGSVWLEVCEIGEYKQTWWFPDSTISRQDHHVVS